MFVNVVDNDAFVCDMVRRHRTRILEVLVRVMVAEYRVKYGSVTLRGNVNVLLKNPSLILCLTKTKSVLCNSNLR